MEAHTMIDEVDKTLRDFQCDVPYQFFKSFICDLTQCVVDSIVIGIFINFMVCLRYRFRVINELLVRNSKQSVTTNIRSLESERILNEQEIDALTKTHEKLCDVSDSISDAFSLVLFCDMAYLFVLVIIDVYLAIKLFILLFTTDMNADVDEDRISFWFAVAQQLTCVVAIFSIKLILLVLSAELVIGEASKTHAFVHKSINCYDEDSIRNKLTIFLTQLINRKPTFTPCGLFELNLPLLLSMVGTLFTYIIILIQFVESDAGCKQFLTEITDNSTNSSLEIVANDTSTNMTNNLMKLIESGKHLPNSFRLQSTCE
ncbi:putative gustatory receptor 28a [Chrysoperla carnea]|uniref:putative gustatory receptor 28a n=1 Tax=Chrysoperla carnea TaxID=189513 RepID=UPI001D098658|nr:putative gustatory receptor 28a [Chrysoperla carnea]